MTKWKNFRSLIDMAKSAGGELKDYCALIDNKKDEGAGVTVASFFVLI